LSTKPSSLRFFAATLALLAVTLTAFLFNSCARKADSPETVRIAAVVQPVVGLVFIADEKGFFKQRGVNAVIRTYEAGVLAVDALLAGEVDVATATEFVMVRKSFDNDSIRTFAQIANTNATELVARKDHGIEKIADLKGKRIGLTRGSVADFFLGSYLKHNNVPFSSVEMVDVVPLATEDALSKGSVDAVVTWEPYTTRIKKHLGKNAVSWPVRGRGDYYFLLLTKDEFLRVSPATAEKMLRALIDAEGFADKHPEEAQRIMESRMKYAPGDVQLRMAKTALRVRLDQALLTLMEAEAQWMIANKLTTKKEMPNYLDMIYLKGLKVVKPEAVGVIH
jgi:ABC-type nitrate/sulfonate/bicarbonate transport system substrate-binding protein